MTVIWEISLATIFSNVVSYRKVKLLVYNVYILLNENRYR